MWVGSFTCLSFKRELFETVHNFKLDTFKLALYTDAAQLTPQTSNYEATGEVPALANGYTAGGQMVTVIDPVVAQDGSAVIYFENVTWAGASFTARGGLVYNASKPLWPSVCVLDFGANRIPNAGNFVVRFPGPILRIV